MTADFDRVTSIKDVRVVEAREISTAAGRKKYGKCLLEGEEIITWALQSGIAIERVFFDERNRVHPLLSRLSEMGTECLAATDGILKKITDTSYLIPIVGVSKIPSDYNAPPGKFALVLDGVRDYGNIGTIIRTAGAFGIRDIISTDIDFDIWYRKIIDASRGMVFKVNLKRFKTGEETVSYLHHLGFQVIATSPHAPYLQSMADIPARPIALVVGGETDGVSKEVLKNADLTVKIPMMGVESLNVGVAAGISVYEFKLKLVLAMLTTYIRSTLGREMNVTGMLIQQALDLHLQGTTDLSGKQVILLMVLHCDRTMTLQQAGNDTATFGEDLNNLLNPLLDRGYIAKTGAESISMTKSGEHFIGSLWGVVESSEEAILSVLKEEERAHFLEYLQRIQQRCIGINQTAKGEHHESGTENTFH